MAEQPKGKEIQSQETGKSVVLEDLLRKGRLPSPYVLENISLTEEQKMELYRAIQAAKGRLQKTLVWATEHYNDDTIHHTETLDGILPLLERESGSPVATILGIMQYFEQEREKVERRAERVAQAKEWLQGIYKPIQEFFLDHRGKVIAGIAALVVVGVVVRGCNGIVEHVRAVYAETQAQYQDQQDRIKQSYLSLEANPPIDVDKLRLTVAQEIKFLTEQDYITQAWTAQEEVNASINEFCTYMIENRQRAAIPPHVGMGVVRHLATNACRTNAPNIFEAAQEYLNSMQQNSISHDAALVYLEQSTPTQGCIDPKTMTTAATVLFQKRGKVPDN